MLLQGSAHTVSVANLKDANGTAQPLPTGAMPSFAVTPPEAATLGTQNADGSMPFTVSASYTGPISILASFSYPDGDAIAFNPATDTVAAPEDVSGDTVIS